MPTLDGFEPTPERPYRQYLPSDDAQAQAAGRACLRAEQAEYDARKAEREGKRFRADLAFGQALGAARDAGLAAQEADLLADEEGYTPSPKARALARLAETYLEGARAAAYRAGRAREARNAALDALNRAGCAYHAAFRAAQAKNPEAAAQAAAQAAAAARDARDAHPAGEEARLAANLAADAEALAHPDRAGA